ncbi:plasmid mobilization protein [Tenacibaculum halocynthiae]|uniref:plasmid mobilization protein n=1 Tax=Tenacibaculum halocynthiae TaxID=1254437 RepID=UPI003D64B10B
MNREIRIQIRLTKLEYEIIKNRAEKVDLSLSEFIRSASFGRRLSYTFSEEEQKIYDTLINSYSDFTKLSNLVSRDNNILSNELRQIAYLIKNELQHIRNKRNGSKE